ncbi:MAG: valine--tRNA ligase [Candidatus Pacebacteria bacterium]|nr:valine--tRNA ligase [Candidatus Paceibacterota bacterium]
MPEKFKKPYDPKAVEEAIYKKWEDSGYFNPDNLPGERTEPFSIVLPPPNVTGTLHVGHAAMLAVEDILVRFERMRGKKTLWVPGTDSAAIATQSKVEDILYKTEKKTRHDIGREELMTRIDAFVEDSKSTIINQLRRMGSSLDWSRYAYTMDEKRYNAVMEAFARMYHAGLIYRGMRIVNWDPKMQTTVSDDEIEWKEEVAPFYYLKYGPFTIATARPETKFGDKYVVMHPDDKRYAQYTHGQKLELEWINGPITATVIKDPAVDMEFGTGVMTITPWHDATDFEIADRHSLQKEQVIDERGLLLPIAGEFAGQHIKKARPMIVEKMQSKGLIEKVDEKYTHNIATNSRGGATIEPQIKMQWFVAVNQEFDQNGTKTTLKKLMRSAVESGTIAIQPDHFAKTYYHWVDNLRDWCISRQIWFGHRIPVWYKGENIHVGANPPSENWQKDGWEQDPDTLDTWFSSGLWTFSTLGWPEETADLKTYHPTSVLETGYDILFFWIARMVLMSGFLLGEVPFKQVYLHGLVRDSQGRKMSKSLGNIINPLDMIDKYGADALRLGLILGAAPGNDIKLAEDRIKGYKNFANKIWNITRFVLENVTEPGPTNEADKKLLEEFRAVGTAVTANLEEYRLDLAAEKLYHYLWDRFAAEIIEESKPIMKSGGDAAASRQSVLMTILFDSLKLLHPFMPHITEEIWQSLPSPKKDLLMVEKWPV